jgi:hypothetical protein
MQRGTAHGGGSIVLNQIQGKLAKRSLFRRRSCAYRANRSRRQPQWFLPTNAMEAPMNIYKGLLFLHGYVTDLNPDEAVRLEYGARTAADEIAPPLGNRVLSRQWFGTRAKAVDALPEVGCVVGGCG